MAYDYEAAQDQAVVLQEAILGILQEHVGASNAIRARVLTERLGEGVGKYSDRRVRIAIAQLRKAGHLILSSVGSRPGYFLAANEQEWRAFRHANFRARALDILETDKAMALAARGYFGDGVQLVLDLGG